MFSSEVNINCNAEFITGIDIIIEDTDNSIIIFKADGTATIKTIHKEQFFEDYNYNIPYGRELDYSIGYNGELEELRLEMPHYAAVSVMKFLNYTFEVRHTTALVLPFVFDGENRTAIKTANEIYMKQESQQYHFQYLFDTAQQDSQQQTAIDDESIQALMKQLFMPKVG